MTSGKMSVLALLVGMALSGCQSGPARSTETLGWATPDAPADGVVIRAVSPATWSQFTDAPYTEGESFVLELPGVPPRPFIAAYGFIRVRRLDASGAGTYLALTAEGRGTATTEHVVSVWSGAPGGPLLLRVPMREYASLRDTDGATLCVCIEREVFLARLQDGAGVLGIAPGVMTNCDTGDEPRRAEFWDAYQRTMPHETLLLDYARDMTQVRAQPYQCIEVLNAAR